MKRNKIPLSSIRRLSRYARVLANLGREDREAVSSRELGESVNIPPALVRRDLAYFGQFGKRGKGYPVMKLREKLREILGVDQSWNIALVGAGNLGRALFTYPGFRDQGFHIVAVFDNNPAKIDKKWKDIKIQNISKLAGTVKRKTIKIGIIAVPAAGAQEVADEMCRCGINAVLNFAPKRLSLSSRCRQASVDLAIELENLSYYLNKLAK